MTQPFHLFLFTRLWWSRGGLIVLMFVTGLCSSVANANDDQFQIGAGDSISITVYGEPDLNLQAKIGASGVLRVALIGDIQVIGKTPKQLSKELEDAFEDGYLVQPSVSVVIDSFRPFYIRGSVNRPGSYKFEFDMTVDQAIAIAGGLTERASKNDWLIFRGEQKQRIEASKETRVFPGDIIQIEKSFF